MSGGAFEYKQFHISEIADCIEEEIKEALQPRPEKIREIAVAVHLSNDADFKSSTPIYNENNNFELTIDNLKRRYKLCLYRKQVKDDGLRENIYRILNSEQFQYAKVYEWHYEHYPHGSDGIEPYYPDYTPETLDIMRTAVRKLREAHIYAQRIDWMLSGDDSEETMKERLEEELNQLHKTDNDSK